MPDLENPNPDIVSSELTNTEVAPSSETPTTTTATSLHVPNITEQATAEAEAQRLASLFMEFLNSSVSIVDDDYGVDDDDDDDGDDDDESDNNQMQSRCTQVCIFFREKIHRLLNIIAYPFMVLFTIISLIMIVTFCILPTLICMTFGICAYYCFMEDPMSLHMLLRYMFSPDNAAEAAFFANGNGSLYPSTQSRSLIQSKLIVRRLLKISHSSVDNNEDDDNDDIPSTKKYSRRHPSSIWIWTDTKCLKFSAPLVFGEESTEDNDEDKKKKKKKRPCRRRRTDNDESPFTGENNGEIQGERQNGDTSVSFNTPRYHRAVQDDDRSNRNIQEGTSNNVAVEPDDDLEEAIVDIPSGDDTELPLAHVEEEEERSIDEEMGNISISVGRGDGDGVGNNDDYDVDEEEEEEGNGDDSRSAEGTMEAIPTGGNHMNDGREDMDVPDIPVCQVCNDTFNETQPKSCDSQNLPNSLEVDYFGIESDVRDRHTACDICLLEYEIGDEVSWSPNLACSHTYHKDCVLDWLVRKPTCPNCRHDYTIGKKDGRG